MEWSGASWGGAEGLLSGRGPSAEMVSGQRPEGRAQGRRAWRSSRPVWQGGVSLGWGGRLERPAGQVLPQPRRLADWAGEGGWRGRRARSSRSLEGWLTHRGD